ncbi:MAG TPA: sugar ABC transporter permease [Aggregatilinea sp.]|uniref:carbohydrate ABC transporter permease n=1 Tax=Aggregatilinea sp. TaxID=2806333 RepID=UPI002C22C76D|nr:sugar ABC transporter permease [Aggregatilinea sp.]HML23747.1 sugar ABC transporter permease [Aggregatilinea sp.]
MKVTYRLNTLPSIEGLTARIPSHISKQVAAYLFLLPALLIFTLVAWYPIVRAFEMSFQDVNLVGDSQWIGLDNFRLMQRDPALDAVWTNTFEFASWSILLGYALPVLLAILIREMRVAQGFFRVVYFLPTVVPISIAIIVWRLIYDPDAGFLNGILGLAGISAQHWLQDPALAKPSIVLVMTWGAFGTTTLIYLSSLQEIPVELYEAAELDGASPLRRIRHVTLPHLFPMMSLLFVFQVLSVAQVFTEPFLLTNGGPGRETLTPVLHIYNRAFMRMDIGYASAWSVMLVLVLMVFAGIYQGLNWYLNRPRTR